MVLTFHTCNQEDDFWRTRNFLREIFLLNGRLEHSWNVARLDHWRWHYIKTCKIFGSVEKGLTIWENTDGRIASFCTIFYDDATLSAVTVLVGTVAEHWRGGLGKAVIIEGLRRLKEMGCTRVFATAHEEPADHLYRSMMQEMKITEPWLKVIK